MFVRTEAIAREDGAASDRIGACDSLKKNAFSNNSSRNQFIVWLHYRSRNESQRAWDITMSCSPPVALESNPHRCGYTRN